MFKWLIKRKTNELIKLVMQNDMALSQIIDMQQLEGAKPLNADFAKWVENRFLINHATLHRFKKSGSIKDQQIVKSLLDLNKDLRRWYDESHENLKFFNFPVKSFDETYKPLRGVRKTHK